MQEALRPPRWYATMLGVAMIVAGGPSLVSGLDLGIRSLAWLAHLEVPDQEVTRITWLTQVPLAVVLFAEGLLFVGVGVVAFVRRPGLGPLLVCLALPSLWGQIHTGVVSGWDRLVPEVAFVGQPWFEATPPLSKYWTLIGAYARLVWPALAMLGVTLYRAWTPLRPPREWATAVLLVVAWQAAFRVEDFYSTRVMKEIMREKGVAWQVQPGEGRLVLVPTLPATASGSAARLPDSRVRVRLWNHLSGVEPRWLETRLVGGVIELPDVPTGEYEVELAIDANPQNAWLGDGDYFAPGPGTTQIAIVLDEDGQSVRREIPLEKVNGSQLEQPEDGYTSPHPRVDGVQASR